MPDSVKSFTDREALSRLSDFIVADIAETSVEELLSEIRDEDGDPQRFAAQMRLRFERTLAMMSMQGRGPQPR